MSAITLHRIDAARNMRRFYALDMEAELFSGVLLMKGKRCFQATSLSATGCA